MIGIMNNPPADNGVEVQAPPPSLRVELRNSLLRIFTEAKDRAEIRYTKNGRKFVNGQLSQNAAQESPEQTWNRIILRSDLKQKVCDIGVICCPDRPRPAVVDDDEFLPPRPLRRLRSKSWTGRTPVKGRMTMLKKKERRRLKRQLKRAANVRGL